MQVSMGMTVLSQKKIERAEFDQRMEEHAKWLKNHEEGKRADFSDVDLSEMDLSGMDFSYAENERQRNPAFLSGSIPRYGRSLGEGLA